MLKPRYFLGIVKTASQTEFHQIRIAKLKVIYAQISDQNEKKTKNCEKVVCVTKGVNKGIKTWGRF